MLLKGLVHVFLGIGPDPLGSARCLQRVNSSIVGGLF